MGSKTTANTSQSTVAPTNLITKIKKEAPDLEIKEYAETAMKEMFGWYGYERGGGSSSDTSSDQETGSSNSVCSKVPLRQKSLKESSLPNIPAGCMCCAWCQRVSNAKQFNFKTPSGKAVFCSEQCFTQCRRANFKRNKTCDWCRHVRHTVNYVDFQDGDHQLQFCSDKCLNQYKMNIFCKETQAHLELHPHLKEGSSNNNNGPGSSDSGSTNVVANLITPELWMRDCRSQSPDTEDRSTTPPRIPSPVVEIKTSPKRNHHAATSDRKPSREGSKRKVIKLRKTMKSDHASHVASDQRTSSLSPNSNGSISPPKVHLPPTPIGQPIPALPHHFLSERPLFFPPGLIPSPHLFPEVRFTPQRLPPPPRTPQTGHIPPLLPINRPMQPPMIPFIPSSPLLPPPTTIVPYPIFIPIPVPIPIPIPLPGVRMSDVVNLDKKQQKHQDADELPPQASTEEDNDNNSNNNDNEESNKNNNADPTTSEESSCSKHRQTLPPPRKRRRINDISQETSSIRSPNSVHA